jgi:hypothetical protein
MFFGAIYASTLGNKPLGIKPPNYVPHPKTGNGENVENNYKEPWRQRTEKPLERLV